MENKFDFQLDKKIAVYLLKNSNLSKQDQIKVSFTISVLLINLSKIAVFLVLAALTNSLFPTLITYSSFLLLRRYAYGYHAMSSLKCTILTAINFWLLPLLLRNVQIAFSTFFLISTFFIFLLLLKKYGGLGTALNPNSSEKVKKMQSRAIVSLLFIFMCLLVKNFDAADPYIFLGASTAIFNLLPITNKLYSLWGN